MGDWSVEIKVKELAQSRGVMKPAHLAKLANLTKPAATRFWNASLSCVDLPNLAKICRALNCDIQDVLRLAKRKR